VAAAEWLGASSGALACLTLKMQTEPAVDPVARNLPQGLNEHRVYADPTDGQWCTAYLQLPSSLWTTIALLLITEAIISRRLSIAQLQTGLRLSVGGIGIWQRMAAALTSQQCISPWPSPHTKSSSLGDVSDAM
jgi:hypothetical protein